MAPGRNWKWGHNKLFSCPFTFLALKVQLVVLVSDFDAFRDGQYSFVRFCLPFFYSGSVADPKILKGGGRQFISSVLIYRKCGQRNICLLHGKSGYLKKMWANRGPLPPSSPFESATAEGAPRALWSRRHCVMTGICSTGGWIDLYLKSSFITNSSNTKISVAVIRGAGASPCQDYTKPRGCRRIVWPSDKISIWSTNRRARFFW